MDHVEIDYSTKKNSEDECSIRFGAIKKNEKSDDNNHDNVESKLLSVVFFGERLFFGVDTIEK